MPGLLFFLWLRYIWDIIIEKNSPFLEEDLS